MNQDELLIVLNGELETVVDFLAKKQIKVSREDLEQQVVLAALEFSKGVSNPPPSDWKESCLAHIKTSLNRYVYQNGGKGGPESRLASLDKQNDNGTSLVKLVGDGKIHRKNESPPTSPSEFIAWAARLRAAAFNAINETDVSEIMQKVTARAKKGNLAAVRLLFDYMLGGKMQTKVHVVKRVEED